MTDNIFLEGDDPEEKRIFQILFPGKELDDLPKANFDQLQNYMVYLKSHLTKGMKLTGREDMGYFSWEEEYSWGNGDADEYEKLKETKASFLDKYLFIKVVGVNEDWEGGIIAEVKRICDGRRFQIPLHDLESVNDREKIAETLDDYASWMTNFYFN